MFSILIIIIQYGSILGGSLFIIWLSTVNILYHNKQCFSINIQKFNYTNNNNNNNSNIDIRLKLNHFTILGTHNSYHKANLIYKYSHENVDKQLSYRIRQIELDIHIMKNNFLIYHLQLFDDQTNCYCFKQCLIKIVEWKKKNLIHYPIYLFIEIKQMFYEDLMTGLTGGVKCEHFQQIKEEILNIFSLNTFILPDQIQGNQSSIKIALTQQRQDELSGDYSYKNYGWPPIYQSLGKIMPIFLDDVHNRALKLYSTCDSLSSFFIIAQRNSELPFSSIITTANPMKNAEKLQNTINNGQMIRLLLDYGSDDLDNTYQLSKQYPIHIISSDSENCNDTLLCQSLNKDFINLTIQCNYYIAPSFCNLSLTFLY